ncbi:uncharacterized protein LOC141614454 [Silene latifolia]|uniref:uncharacterized protein LOC141614454 n=1 Tax=Silene latifolia TaxID=37657 RepID=UPI003D76D753
MITLIPKTDRPTSVKHFRPIACCNVIYKTISKIMCARLAVVLPDIISRNQGAFIQGRSILENILICQDLVRMYNRGNASPRCMFKLDLQKAYDSIEWDFIEQMLTALKFPEKFKHLVMTCVRTPHFSLQLDGSHFGYFAGKRGLRQGDPISPLLFTICMEYLSRVLMYATQNWFFRFHPLCRSLKLTHLLFADDLLLFCRGDVRSIMLLLRAFSTFSATSGLVVNEAKSEVVFAGVSDELKQDILQISGFQEGGLPFRYLGIPIQPGRLTKQDCNILVERIEDCGHLQEFLWDGGTEYQRAPLVSWSTVCCSKKTGGLGVKDAESWNIANVGKLVNCLYTDADRLWVQWIHHVYLKDADWSTYVPPCDSNWNWRNICKIRCKMSAGYVDNCWVADPKGYSVGSGYTWLQEQHPLVTWYSDVWDRWNIPKHAFIAWLISHKALNTREKLHAHGISDSKNCVLCENGIETHSHLFEDCLYSKQILGQIETWLQLALDPDRRCSQLQQHVCRMAKLAYWYTIWLERNKSRLDLQLTVPRIIVKDLKRLIHARISQMIQQPVTSQDQQWISSLDILF